MQVREADYSKPETLAKAFAGAEKGLLISSNDLENRIPQQRAVVDAAKGAGVKLIAYTSLLRADTSKLGLANADWADLVCDGSMRDSALAILILTFVNVSFRVASRRKVAFF